MPIEIAEAPAAQTLQGQPVEAEPAPAAVETPAAEPAAEPVAAQVNIDPAALRQITTLSKNNRELTKKLADLETKLAASTMSDEVKAKLELADRFIAAKGRPRELLALAEKTLEEVAADVMASVDELPADPRVDAALAKLDALEKEREAEKNARTEAEKKASEEAQAKGFAAAVEYVKGVVASTKLDDGAPRWERLAKDEKSASEAVRAAILVRERDFKGKTVTDEQATEVLHRCLDEAEAVLIGKETLEARRAGKPATAEVQRRGIELRDAAGPKPTIDGARGPTRSLTVPRGQTDVRTARARALQIAKGE